MGSSESKTAVPAQIKPGPAIKNSHVSHLIDPRSPSTAIDRTPIQVSGPLPKAVAVTKTECLLEFTDPRSPTVGITRTPVREVMRATVGSFARRLGMLFHNEIEGKAPQKHFNDATEEVFKGEELGSTEPLLTPLPHRTFGSMAEHSNLLVTPVMPPLPFVGDSSPYVLLEEPQFEVELQTEDLSLEEAEEARESPLHKRLSSSLITCHDGATSSQVFVEVHCDSPSSPVPSVKVETLMDGADHSYALPLITVKSESPGEPVQSTDADCFPAQVSQSQSQELEQTPSSDAMNKLSAHAPSDPPTVRSLGQPQPSAGIRCPTFDPKSPSQVVFKPQWLGKGFGATGLRARGVQGHSGKGGSSPLAMAVAVKNIANENKGQSGKRKQKGTEIRSPLQILRETNSPRDQRPQIRLKVSTPDKQRLGQMDCRVLAVSLDKENR